MARLQLLAIVAFLFCTIQQAYTNLQTNCNADFCDPNWTPFDNMVSSLRGYNIRKGNPIHNNGDPGFLGQIFYPTKLNELGRVELETGITASELTYCQRSMTSHSFTTMESYRKFVTDTSSSGMDLQLGTEKEVTVGIEIKGIGASQKQNIPAPFTRAWGESKDFQQLSSFFSEEQGMVSSSMGTCTMYEVKLDRFHLPPFTTPFITALGQLYKARNDADHIRKGLFRQFIGEYGTHFLLRTKLGATYMYRSKYSKTARKTLNAETLQECNYVKGSKVFGIQVEEDSSGCKSTDEDKLNTIGRENVVVDIITKGSRPTDIKSWATQEFTPIPLKFQLSPIVNLMKNQSIDDKNLMYGDEKISSVEIRKWFLPLYFDYCNSMNIDCGEKTGCGIDDKCPVDTICKKSGSVHECGQWSEWKCAASCGPGVQVKRTRSCQGCEGETEQYRAQLCSSPTCPDRYPYWPSEFRWSYTGSISGYQCLHVIESADPNDWHDNYLCAKSGTGLRNIGMRWSSAGRISGMRCVQVNEPSDEHTWHDNYLCVPYSSPYNFQWSYAGRINGLWCIQWVEPSDSSAWNDNYLCHNKYTG